MTVDKDSQRSLTLKDKENIMRYRPNHVAISCRNLENSLAFYYGLGFQEIIRSSYDGGKGTVVHAKLDEFVIELFAFPENESLPPLDLGFANELDQVGVKHLALATEDIEAALVDLKDRGLADETAEIGSLPDGSAKWIFVRDPDGMWVEIIEERRFSLYQTP